jgi:hypothetical protein
MPSHAYPWYELVSGDTLEQGDILEACPVFSPPEDLAGEDYKTAMFIWDEVDVIVLSQSCDLVKGREKVSEVLLCPVFQRSESTEGYLATPKGMEEARRGNLPGFYVLAESQLMGWLREVRIVDFKQVFALPLAFARRQASLADQRLRLLPPYREHLAQAFARYFMRIGLPTDIPPFK